ncbi:unnamed protein product [Symbiodinium sp. CCMP2592]|nr:unnamed protein product [Symbiodinium sp. CCMP2592]CAE7436659.1 unnamed protein product [Symbiodinium sp. CCMP2592]
MSQKDADAVAMVQTGVVDMSADRLKTILSLKQVCSRQEEELFQKFAPCLHADFSHPREISHCMEKLTPRFCGAKETASKPEAKQEDGKAAEPSVRHDSKGPASPAKKGRTAQVKLQEREKKAGKPDKAQTTKHYMFCSLLSKPNMQQAVNHMLKLMNPSVTYTSFEIVYAPQRGAAGMQAGIPSASRPMYVVAPMPAAEGQEMLHSPRTVPSDAQLYMFHVAGAAGPQLWTYLSSCKDSAVNTLNAGKMVTVDSRLPWTWVAANSPRLCIILRHAGAGAFKMGEVQRALAGAGFPKAGPDVRMMTLPEAMASGPRLMKLGGIN